MTNKKTPFNFSAALFGKHDPTFFCTVCGMRSFELGSEGRCAACAQTEAREARQANYELRQVNRNILRVIDEIYNEIDSVVTSKLQRFAYIDAVRRIQAAMHGECTSKNNTADIHQVIGGFNKIAGTNPAPNVPRPTPPIAPPAPRNGAFGIKPYENHNEKI